MKIKLFVPNDDWAKVCHAITRMMGPPIMQGTEALGGLRKLSDGTDVFPHGYQGEQVVYRLSAMAADSSGALPFPDKLLD